MNTCTDEAMPPRWGAQAFIAVSIGLSHPVRVP